jgi:CelD/BcsL family acetyltransferase involved in cellulose biosynthesis
MGDVQRRDLLRQLHTRDQLDLVAVLARRSALDRLRHPGCSHADYFVALVSAVFIVLGAMMLVTAFRVRRLRRRYEILKREWWIEA